MKIHAKQRLTATISVADAKAFLKSLKVPVGKATPSEGGFSFWLPAGQAKKAVQALHSRPSTASKVDGGTCWTYNIDGWELRLISRPGGVQLIVKKA